MKTVCAIVTFTLLAGISYALTPAEEAAIRSVNPENKPCVNCAPSTYSGKATVNPANKPLLHDDSSIVWVEWIPGPGVDVIDEMLHPKKR